MWRYVAGFSIIALMTVKGIEQYVEFQEYREANSSGYSEPVQPQRVAKAVEPAPDSNDFLYDGRKARIKINRQGHFVTNAKMNGRRVEVLVDTGATSVAINRSTARKLGIFLKASDFKYTVNTANGSTKAAAAYIDRIEIGRVTVKNVRAAVLNDRALSSSLLGMTFLGELKGFEVKNRELILTQ